MNAARYRTVTPKWWHVVERWGIERWEAEFGPCPHPETTTPYDQARYGLRCGTCFARIEPT